MQPPEFGKVHITESYFNGRLSSTGREIEIQKKTSKRQFLADIMELTSDSVDGDCKEMTLVIRSDKQGPVMLEIRKKMKQVD